MTSLSSLFGELCKFQIPPVAGSPVGKRVSKKEKDKDKDRNKSIQNSWEKLEGILLSLNSEKQHAGTWAGAFHSRMLESRTFFDPEKKDHIFNLLSHYLTTLPNNMACLKIAKGVIEHLYTHRLDIDNLLIGLQPNKTVRHLAYQRFINNVKFKPTDKSDKPPLDPVEAFKGIFLWDQPKADEHEHENSREWLVEKIINWAALDNAALLQREVRELATALKGIDAMCKGDLLLAGVPRKKVDKSSRRVGEACSPQLEGDDEGWLQEIMGTGPDTGSHHIVFGRFVCRRDDGNVDVTVDPNENAVVTVPAMYITPLPTSALPSFKSERQIERLTEDMIDLFSQQCIEQIRVFTIRHLEAQGCNADIMDRVARSDCSLVHLMEVKKLLKQLSAIMDAATWQPFLDELKGKVEQRCLYLQTVLDREHIPYFHLNLRRLDDIKNLNCSAFAKSRVSRYIAACETCLHELQKQYTSMLDSTLKGKLTHWWLDLIERETICYLSKLGFDSDALPEDYLETPPTKMDHVKANLVLIKEVIDPRNDKHKTKEFIEKLKRHIYPVIDDYVIKCKAVLTEKLPEVEDVPEKELLNHLSSLDASTISDFKQLEGLAKDINYLTRMRELEEQPDVKVLDIVPITGLIIGRFVRMENELKTAIDHWEQHGGGGVHKLRNNTPSKRLSMRQSSLASIGVPPSPPIPRDDNPNNYTPKNDRRFARKVKGMSLIHQHASLLGPSPSPPNLNQKEREKERKVISSKDKAKKGGSGDSPLFQSQISGFVMSLSNTMKSASSEDLISAMESENNVNSSGSPKSSGRMKLTPLSTLPVNFPFASLVGDTTSSKEAGVNIEAIIENADTSEKLDDSLRYYLQMYDLITKRILKEYTETQNAKVLIQAAKRLKVLRPLVVQVGKLLNFVPNTRFTVQALEGDRYQAMRESVLLLVAEVQQVLAAAAGHMEKERTREDTAELLRRVVLLNMDAVFV